MSVVYCRLTYGVKILTQRGFFSPLAYSKQNAMPSSSVSQRCISAHSNDITWFWWSRRENGKYTHTQYEPVCTHSNVFPLVLCVIEAPHTHYKSGYSYSNLTHLKRAVLCAGVQLEVVHADGRDDVALPPGVTGAVGEHDLIVSLTGAQQTQILTDTRQQTAINHTDRHQTGTYTYNIQINTPTHYVSHGQITATRKAHSHCTLWDAFIESDIVHTFYVRVVPGIEPTILCCKRHALPTKLTEDHLQWEEKRKKRLEKGTNHGHLALLCQFCQLVRLVFCFDESLLHVIQCLSRQRKGLLLEATFHLN